MNFVGVAVLLSTINIIVVIILLLSVVKYALLYV